MPRTTPPDPGYLTPTTIPTTPLPSPTPTQTPGDPDPEPPAPIRIVTFNALGHSHTKPGGNKCCDWAQYDVRIRWLVRALRPHRPDVIGFQEFPGIQRRAFVELRGDEFAVWGSVDNHIAYRRDRFVVEGRRFVVIPYFRGKPRKMPVLTLRDLRSDVVFTVINVHNPASVRGPAARYRDTAVARELEVVRQERKKGRPVLLVGDFNAKDSVFCALTRVGMVAANGGSNVDGDCRPPQMQIIDWIFAAGGELSGYLADDSVQGTVSDHRMVSAWLRPEAPAD